MYKQWLTYDGLSYNHPSYMIEWKNLITLPKDWKIIVNANGNKLLKQNVRDFLGFSKVVNQAIKSTLLDKEPIFMLES